MGLTDTKGDKNMACYSPLKGYAIGKTINGKTDYHITSYDTIMYDCDGNIREYVEIPCGRCIGCRLQYSRMWADRCLAESTLHDDSYFVTLTYDDYNIPKSNYDIDKETGEVKTSCTLVKRDFQLFMKRLRKNYKYDNNLRFYMAGEYGSQTARPHYHAIIYGLKLDDLKLYKRTPLGFNLYNSEFVNECWQHKGHVVIAEVTWETCAYTARYIMKKQTGSKAEEVYERYNIIPPFTLMSRRPGIAKEFYEQNKERLIKFGEVDISTKKGGKKIKSVKYFNKFLEIEYPDEYNIKSESTKKHLEVIKKKKLEQTSVSYLEMLNNEKEVKEKRIERLKRGEI